MSREKQIMKLFSLEKTIITKKEITEKLGNTYYHNGSKHLGDVLSRMVNNGTLIRLKLGVFEIRTKQKEFKWEEK